MGINLKEKLKQAKQELADEQERISVKNLTALHALGIPRRLVILYELKDHCGHCGISELSERLHIPRSTLDHHLTVLLKAGLIGNEMLPLKDKQGYRRYQYTYLITAYGNEWLRFLETLRFKEIMG